MVGGMGHGGGTILRGVFCFGGQRLLSKPSFGCQFASRAFVAQLVGSCSMWQSFLPGAVVVWRPFFPYLQLEGSEEAATKDCFVIVPSEGSSCFEWQSFLPWAVFVCMSVVPLKGSCWFIWHSFLHRSAAAGQSSVGHPRVGQLFVAKPVSHSFIMQSFCVLYCTIFYPVRQWS